MAFYDRRFYENFACNEHGWCKVGGQRYKFIRASNADKKFICDYKTWKETLRLYTWRYDRFKKFPVTNVGNKSVSMMAMLLPDVPEGCSRLHINGNYLDNRMENIAIVTKDDGYILRHTVDDGTGLADILFLPHKRAYVVYTRLGNDVTVYCETRSKYEAMQLRDIYNLDKYSYEDYYND